MTNEKNSDADKPPVGALGSAARHHSQRGSAMIEFAVVGPLLTLIGLIILQYAMMFNAKNLVNHASFMAARAGTMQNANLGSVRVAYAKALIALYGGGRDSAELVQAYAKAQADTSVNAKIDLLNPTKESFDDWNDTDLQAKYGARAIPNAGQSFKNPGLIKSSSGQNIQDANLIKLKISHGYELKVPLAGTMIQFMMKTMDSNKDAFSTAMYSQRRIPLVSNITMQMQSDAIERGTPISVAGMGNNGTPTDPGFTEDPVKPPPRCITMGCTVIIDPTSPPGATSPPMLGCPPGSTTCTPLPPTCTGA